MNINEFKVQLDGTVNTDYYVPSVNYPAQFIKLIASLKEHDIISKSDYKSKLHALIHFTFNSPLCWEICAEFWKMFFDEDYTVEVSLELAISEWNK